MNAFFILRDNERIKACTEYVQSLNPNDNWCVEIKEYTPQRSKQQNSAIHGWSSVVSKELGYENNYIKEKVKIPILGGDVIYVDDIEYYIPKSSARATVKEGIELITAIEIIARQFNIRLPHRDDYNYLMKGNK